MQLDKQEQQVDLNYRVFEQHLDSLMEAHEGKWVLLRDGAIIDIFETARAAFEGAWSRFDDELFSVQEITKTPVDLGFYSHAGYPGKA